MASINIQQALQVRFKAYATLVTEVSTRMYWLEAPQNVTYPYLIYFIVSDPHDPLAFGRVDTGQPRVQVNVYDNNKYEALRIGNIAWDALDKYAGTVDGVTIESINCSGTRCIKMADQDIYMATFDALVRYDDV